MQDGLRGKELTLAIVKLAMDGVPPATISKRKRLPRWKLWFHLRKAEAAGIISRVPGARNPALFQSGPNAALLMGGWPYGRVGNLQGGSKGGIRTRIHAVNFVVQVLAGARSAEHDVAWRKTKPWGRCPSKMCRLRIDSVGTVRIRMMGRRRMVVYTPEFYADARQVKEVPDMLAARVQGVLVHLSKTYGYRFGAMKFAQRPEFAFPVDRPAIRDLLAKTRAKSADGKWWVDASPASGGAEVETRDMEEAERYLAIPDRVERLEGLVADLAKHQRTDHTTLERLTGVVESLARMQAENHESTMSHLSRLTWVIKELGDKLDRKNAGPMKEN